MISDKLICQTFDEYNSDEYSGTGRSILYGDFPSDIVYIFLYMNTRFLTHKIISSYIIGGEDTEPGEYPHMAAVGYVVGQDAIEFKCIGSIISNRYVLTAAHCADRNVFGQLLIVRLGDHRLHSDGSRGTYKDYGIENVILHPNYRPPHTNNIALIKLNEEIGFNQNTKPAKLYSNINQLSRYKLSTTGWGKNNDILKTVDLNFFTHANCNQYFGRALSQGFVDVETQVCAGIRKSRPGTCGGNFGSPLQMSRETPATSKYSGWTIVGITSISITCGSGKVPALYTRVFHYVPWINSIIKSSSNNGAGFRPEAKSNSHENERKTPVRPPNPAQARRPSQPHY